MVIEEIVLIVWIVFILFASIKTFLLIKYFRVFDEVKRYLLLPNVFMSVLFVSTLMLTIKDLSNSQKLIVLAFTLLGGLADVLGRKKKNKIFIVSSLLFYMYVVGVCWTKSLNFIVPYGA